jgi:hypothetical protein
MVVYCKVRLCKGECEMTTPFPGMDPYLERSGLWEEVHAGLIITMQQFLSARLRPRYRAAVERRTYLAVVSTDPFVGKPDVLIVSPSAPGLGTSVMATTQTITPRIGELPMPEEIIERYLEIREVETEEVITVIELLSPSNKQRKEGRRQYEEKRLRVLGSGTHLVEIDLIRAGEPLPVRVGGNGRQSDYRIIVSRAKNRPRADVYLFSVRDPIPDFPIPLRPGENEPILPLNQLLHDLYDLTAYDLAIDYSRPPEPPLSDEDNEWAAELLSVRGLGG